MVMVVRPEGEGVKARVVEHTSDTSSRDKSAGQSPCMATSSTHHTTTPTLKQ